MENHLFLAYLKYQKDNKPNVWKSFFKLPKHIIIIFALLAISIIVVMIASIFNVENLVVASLIIEIFACILMYYFSDKHFIKFSEINYNKYCNYCDKLNIWLKEHSINTDENIDELLQRLKVQISETKSDFEKSTNRSEKWLQTLVIPIILALITTNIKNQTDLTSMIIPVFTILVFFIVLYITITSITKLVSFPQKRRIEQMQCFANDLQGVLDYRKKASEAQAS